MTKKTGRLKVPADGYAFFVGYLSGTLDHKRSVSVSDWNHAVLATHRELYELARVDRVAETMTLLSHQPSGQESADG